ncbi:MAG: DnaJ C-terminal domain-containing protein [Verrucomicrobiota bacterium]
MPGPKFRDYYEILGVPRNASEERIRQAFRQLARVHHPDVAAEADKEKAEERFKEINEAYEVLSDSDKRAKYDRLGPDWQHMGDFHHHGGPGNAGPGFGPTEGTEFHFEGTGFSDFFENLFGGRGQGAGPFAYQSGGMDHPFGASSSPPRRPPRKGRDLESSLLVSLEEALTGATRFLTLRHPGDPGNERHVRVHIPPGIESGQTIRCAGQGAAGLPGGPPGDLLLHVKLARHPLFHFKGGDLYHTVQLAPWEAMLGTAVEVPTLHGPVRLRIPPGTAPGTAFRITGKGLPNPAGETDDLYAQVEIVLPTDLTEEEEEHWKALADLSSFQPRNNPSSSS